MESTLPTRVPGRGFNLGRGLGGALGDVLDGGGRIVGNLDIGGVDVDLQVAEAVAGCLAHPLHFLREGRRLRLAGHASIEQGYADDVSLARGQ